VTAALKEKGHKQENTSRHCCINQREEKHSTTNEIGRTSLTLIVNEQALGLTLQSELLLLLLLLLLLMSLVTGLFFLVLLLNQR